MLIQVHHISSFRYSAPVLLGAHTLRFVPRADGAQQILAYELKIEPHPLLLSSSLDVEGNLCQMAWFEDETRSLSIDVAMEVDTLRQNAFDYIPEAHAQALPMAYSEQERRLLQPYMAGVGDLAVSAFIQPLLEQSGAQTLAFLNHLNQAVHAFYHQGTRVAGATQTAAETLRMQDGVCRDLAELYIACCREAGLAARFVSGYQTIPEHDHRKRYLHAWPEVYIPGGGWRGYDPTRNLAVSDQHVAICASVNAAATTPITGGFSALSGTVSSELQADIEISPARPD